MATWTEDEARAFGLVKDKDGNWHQKGQANRSVRGSNEVPKPQSVIRGRPKESPPMESSNEKRYEICVISYRHKVTDPDNLCAKAWIDELVLRGYLPDDSAKHVARSINSVIIVSRSKPETTEIEIWKIIP